MEKFVEIKGYERYSVSNYGRVINNQTGTTLSQRRASNGYLRVNLRKGNVKYEKPYVASVHRLVAEAFIENPNNYPAVNHIDANKENNCVSNLEWCTFKHNSIHAYEHIKGYPQKCAANLEKAQTACRKPIKVSKGGALIGVFESETTAAKMLGINKKTIYNGLHGMTNRHGYSFEYGGEVI